MAIATPEINALCINPKDRISNDMTNDDACVAASKLLSIVLLIHHFQKTYLTDHERIMFDSDKQHDLLID